MPERIKRTYEDIERFARETYEQFKDVEPTHVVGVARGGVVLASYVAYYFDLPLDVTNYSSVKGRGWYPKESVNFLDDTFYPECRVLVIDDDCDTGNTLEDISDYFRVQRKCHVWTAVLQQREGAKYPPNFSLYTIPKDSIMHYPWHLDTDRPLTNEPE